jgi:hypothetical protein
MGRLVAPDRRFSALCIAFGPRRFCARLSGAKSSLPSHPSPPPSHPIQFCSNGATQELAFGFVMQAGITEESQWPSEGESALESGRRRARAALLLPSEQGIPAHLRALLRFVHPAFRSEFAPLSSPFHRRHRRLQLERRQGEARREHHWLRVPPAEQLHRAHERRPDDAGEYGRIDPLDGSMLLSSPRTP